MKYLTLLLVAISLTFGQTKEKKVFKVTYSITVDSLTLNDANRIEDVLREFAWVQKRKCVLDIKLEERQQENIQRIFVDSVYSFPRWNWKYNQLSY